MAPDPVLHERIYAALKADLRDGRFTPGQHIDLQSISYQHRASITPVREVVCRLVGEGIVEFQRHGGFRVTPLGADTIRGLYMLNMAIALYAIRISGDEELDRAVGSFRYPAPKATAIDLASSTSALFAALGAASGLNTLLQTLENISDRLSSIRIAEVRALRDVRRELLMINHGPRGEIRRTLGRRIANYHRRRVAASEKIAELLITMNATHSSQ